MEPLVGGLVGDRPRDTARRRGCPPLSRHAPSERRARLVAERCRVPGSHSQGGSAPRSPGQGVMNNSPRRPIAAFIVNPVGVADLDAFREKAAASLARRGWAEPTWWETTPDDPGGGVAAKTVHERPDLVILAGGDGTVRACAGVLAGTGIPVGVLGFGTGNLLARNLGLPTDLTGGLDCALDGVDRRIDLGTVGDERFAVMAGVGLDAGMVERTPAWLKAKIGWPAYVVGIVRKLLDRPMRARIRI